MFDTGLFTLPFMAHAWESGTIVAVLSAFTGFFIVLRKSSFAAHALPEAGFAGGAGAVLLCVNPVYGLAAFAMVGALLVGCLEKRGRGDTVTALMLTAALGTGALFLTFADKYASGAYALLFGQIVGVSSSQVLAVAAIAIVCIVCLMLMYRPLLLSSVSEEIARAKGLPARALNIAFLVIVGLAASAIVPIVGALLCFSLLVCPTAAAMLFSLNPRGALLLSLIFSLLDIWFSIALGYYTGLPVGFFVSVIGAALYAGARIFRRLRQM